MSLGPAGRDQGRTKEAPPRNSNVQGVDTETAGEEKK